jgi:predicted transcriptional regulator
MKKAGIKLIEEDIFKCIIPLSLEAAVQATDQVTPEDGTKSALSRHQVEIMRKCLEEKALLYIMAIAGRSDRTKFRNQVLNPLFEMGLIEMTIPDKPRSSKQKYRLTDKGRALLEQTDPKEELGENH